MQSNLHGNIFTKTNMAAEQPYLKTLRFPEIKSAIGPITHAKQIRLLFIYSAAYLIGCGLFFLTSSIAIKTLGLGLVFPGAGFLAGSTDQGFTLSANFIFFGVSVSLFMSAVFLWFATGNVILPPCVWAASTIAATVWAKANIETIPTIDAINLTVFALLPAALVILVIARLITRRLGQNRRVKLNRFLESQGSGITNSQLQTKPEDDELSLEDLQHMRLLLDRALQPVDDFEGFEWADQFQTAAIRYQINFISYALSLAQFNYMPAFEGYLTKAQDNLRTKQENNRIWKYWALENLWGNLRLNADPIIRDNIMYSGFVGAQIALSAQARQTEIGADIDGLKLERSGKTPFSYSFSKLVETLTAQYKTAKYGLLPCEPNWVYPLCNTITATAIRAHDSRYGSAHWDSIKAEFSRILETEFIRPDGRFIPFKSSYTGLAAPQIGGAVMQAFPCFFLNAVLPDIARRQWLTLKHDMQGKSWQRALWPIDVGNYKFSRASSYASTALAAREMGDNETADLLLEHLNTECPKVTYQGVSFHSKASLWANANAFMAKTSRPNALRNLINMPPNLNNQTPYLREVDYTQALIAKAKWQDSTLDIIAYPADQSGSATFGIAGLKPKAAYRIKQGGAVAFHADAHGKYVMNAVLGGRTRLQISQVH